MFILGPYAIEFKMFMLNCYFNTRVNNYYTNDTVQFKNTKGRIKLCMMLNQNRPVFTYVRIGPGCIIVFNIVIFNMYIVIIFAFFFLVEVVINCSHIIIIVFLHNIIL